MADVKGMKNDSDDKLQAECERIKTRLAADAANCAVWEYIIAEKRLVNSRKLNGRYQEENKVINDYRNTILNWGLVYAGDMDEFNRMCCCMDNGEPSFTADIRMISDTGRFAWFRYIGETVKDASGKSIKVAGITCDVTELRHGTGLVDDASLCDDVTKLYNKGCVVNMIDERLMSVTSSDISGLFFIVDIDNFIEIRDRWGHVFAEGVLKKTADVLRTHVKDTDIIGHIGLDIFVIFCDNICDMDIANDIAIRLMKSLSAIKLNENCELSASLGIACSPRDGRDFDTLFRCADIALYHAKSKGKNDYEIYRPGNSNAMAEYEARRAEEKRSTTEALSTAEISDVQRRLFDFSFDTFNSMDSFDDAVSSIFREICIDLGIDIITLIEYDYMTAAARVRAVWYVNVREDKEEVEKLYTKHWGMVCGRYVDNERCQFDCLSTKNELFEDMQSAGFNAKSVMQLPIFDGDKLMAVINYTVYRNIKPWSYSETAAITSISRMIGGYYLRTRSRNELENETAFNSAAMRAQKSIYYIVDADFRIVYMSSFAADAYPDIKIGKRCYECMGSSGRQCDTCPIKGIGDDDEHNSYSIETYSDNEEKWLLKSAIRLKANHNGGKYLVCLTDVTGFLTRVKFTDQLTGLMNYDKFVANAVRLYIPGQTRYAIGFIGINDFTEINDEFGYSAGDRVLKKLASRFAALMTDAELVARIKGDDFLVLMSYRDDIREIISRITAAFDDISGQMKKEYQNMHLDFICGLYPLRNDDYSFTAAVDRASVARREALKQQPNPCRMFIYTKEYENRIRLEKEFENTMKEALANGEFKVFIQPKVTLPDGRIGGGEALVRWIKPDGTIIPPAKFIPLFERNGFVLDVDNHVYETLLAQMHIWMKEGKRVPQLSVNVSRVHLLDDRFPAYFSELVDQYDIPHELVEIEITESVFFDNVERMINMISKLRSMRFPISMDDFGTGYSTLNLMKSLPIDILKIDGGFFLKCPLDPKNKAIISAIINLGHSLNLKLVAEGIETKDQDDFISAEHCDYAQGYYHYRPMTMEAFGELI